MQTALRLEIITIVWMVIEAAVAVAAGIVARSLLLVAFGIDSAIELASAVVVFRRFQIESHKKFDGGVDDARGLERRTARIAESRSSSARKMVRSRLNTSSKRHPKPTSSSTTTSTSSALQSKPRRAS